MLPTTKKTNSKKKKKKAPLMFMFKELNPSRTGKVEAKGGGRLTDKNNSAIVLDSKTKTKRKVKKAKAGGRLTDKNNSAIVLDSKTKTKRKVKKAKSGGKVSNTKNATPKSKPPVTDSTNPKTGATRGSGAKMVSAKKMGGGQVMKYKKGGMVYKQGGGVIKASNSGDSLIAACYD